MAVSQYTRDMRTLKLSPATNVAVYPAHKGHIRCIPISWCHNRVQSYRKCLSIVLWDFNSGMDYVSFLLPTTSRLGGRDQGGTKG